MARPAHEVSSHERGREVSAAPAPPARSRWRVPLVVLAVLALIVWGLARGVDEPLRRRIEANANQSLQGYALSIGAVRFHPLGLSIDFIELRVAQNSHPDLPLLDVPLLHASVHWGAVLHRKLVADFRLDRPTVR